MKLRWIVIYGRTVLEDRRVPLVVDIPWFTDRARWLGLIEETRREPLAAETRTRVA